MFMVGGSIRVHGLAPVQSVIDQATQWLAGVSGTLIALLAPTLLSALFGILAGGLIVGAMSLGKLFHKPAGQ